MCVSVYTILKYPPEVAGEGFYMEAKGTVRLKAHNDITESCEETIREDR